jgi:hypothetical protein
MNLRRGITRIGWVVLAPYEGFAAFLHYQLARELYEDRNPCRADRPKDELDFCGMDSTRYFPGTEPTYGSIAADWVLWAVLPPLLIIALVLVIRWIIRGFRAA